MQNNFNHSQATDSQVNINFGQKDFQNTQDYLYQSQIQSNNIDFPICVDINCKQQSKVISDFTEVIKYHNGHQITTISTIIKNIADDPTHPCNLLETFPKPFMMIDNLQKNQDEIFKIFKTKFTNLINQLNKIIRTDSLQVTKFFELYSLLVNRNYQALESYQSDLVLYFGKDRSSLDQVFTSYQNLQQRLTDGFRNLKNYFEDIETLFLSPKQLSEIDRTNINLSGIKTVEPLVKFNENFKASHIKIDNQIASSSQHNSGIVLINPIIQLDQKQSVSVEIISKNVKANVRLVDLAIAKQKDTNFFGIQGLGSGCYAIYKDGYIYSNHQSDFNDKQSGFKFSDVQKLKLEYSANTFTVTNLNTQQKISMIVQTTAKSKLYFAVGLGYNNSACILE